MREKIIKILCCSADLRGRGAENVLVTFLQYVNRNKFEARLFVYDSKLRQLELPEGIKVHSANAPGKEPNPVFQRVVVVLKRLIGYIKTIKEYDPDIILTFAGTNEVTAIAKKLLFIKIPLLMSEHSVMTRVINDKYNGIDRVIKKFLTKALYSQANKIIVPAMIAKTDLVKNIGIDDNAITIIPNPVDTDKIDSCKVSYTKDAAIKRVGFVGNLSPEKNVECLLSAFHLLLKTSRESVELQIVGDGVERNQLTELTRTLQIESLVHFEGFQKNPIKYIQAFDVLVLPSKSEVLPCVIFEAMYCGIPVVTSNWEGCKDVFKNGEDCLVVELDNSQELAYAILKVLSQKDLREKLLFNGKKKAMEMYAPVIVEKYEKLIASLAGSMR